MTSLTVLNDKVYLNIEEIDNGVYLVEDDVEIGLIYPAVVHRMGIMNLETNILKKRYVVIYMKVNEYGKVYTGWDYLSESKKKFLRQVNHITVS